VTKAPNSKIFKVGLPRKHKCLRMSRGMVAPKLYYNRYKPASTSVVDVVKNWTPDRRQPAQLIPHLHPRPGTTAAWDYPCYIAMLPVMGRVTTLWRRATQVLNRKGRPGKTHFRHNRSCAGVADHPCNAGFFFIKGIFGSHCGCINLLGRLLHLQ
jgi:hypothetical protein